MGFAFGVWLEFCQLQIIMHLGHSDTIQELLVFLSATAWKMQGSANKWCLFFIFIFNSAFPPILIFTFRVWLEEISFAKLSSNTCAFFKLSDYLWAIWIDT